MLGKELAFYAFITDVFALDDEQVVFTHGFECPQALGDCMQAMPLFRLIS